MAFGRHNIIADGSAGVIRRHHEEKDARNPFLAALVDPFLDRRTRILESRSRDQAEIYCGGQESRLLLCRGRKGRAPAYEPVTHDCLLFSGCGQLAPCEHAHEFWYFVDRARPSKIDEQHSAFLHLRLLPLCTASMRRATLSTGVPG